MNPHAPLLIDIIGTQLSATDTERLRHPHVGGLILFTRNWHDRAQLGDLCHAIKDIRTDLLICVDHEGGRVQRFRGDGFTRLPAMAQFGRHWHDDPQAACAAASACGYVLASELRACGIDLSFTPVLDLDWGRSAVIGDRAFAAQASVVCQLADSLMQGLRQAGMANCGKHFPGHGFVAADSHTEAPVDPRNLAEILADDAAPYGWLGGALASVMPAHVVYPAVDARAAGFSKVWLQDILRGRLGFDGVIFSDDLSMAGARVIDGHSVSPTDAALVALNAGCDMVLLCNQSAGSQIDELLDGLSQAATDHRWQPDPTSELRRRSLLPDQPAPGWADLLQQDAYQQALALLP